MIWKFGPELADMVHPLQSNKQDENPAKEEPGISLVQFRVYMVLSICMPTISHITSGGLQRPWKPTNLGLGLQYFMQEMLEQCLQ